MALDYGDLLTGFVRFYDPDKGDPPPAPGGRFRILVRLDDHTIHVGGDDGAWHNTGLIAHDHDASAIISGVLALARIPNLPASQTNSGVFDIARIPTIPVANVSGLGSLATLNAVGSAQITDGSIGTNDLADDAVTLAKMAHGTAGTVIGFNGSGVPSEISPSTPARWRKGLEIRALTASTIIVGTGEMMVNGTLVEKTSLTTLGMATNGDWIGGTSNEFNDEFVWVYVDANGNIRLHNKAPNYTRPNTADRVATMLVNQSGWTGTAGSGLNATSVAYDNDTGEGNITAGMLAVIYAATDSDYSYGRGRGSGAGGSRYYVSTALITAVDTSSNVLTLEAGHNIAIFDNDRIIVVPYGAFEYRQESSTWYRLIGAMWNNTSYNLETDRQIYRHFYKTPANTVYFFSAAGFPPSAVNIDTSNVWALVLATGGYIKICNKGTWGTFENNAAKLDINFDGTSQYFGEGILQMSGHVISGNSIWANMSSTTLLRVLPGTHNVIWQFGAGGAGGWIGRLASLYGSGITEWWVEDGNH